MSFRSRLRFMNLERILEWFIPEDLAAEKETRKRVRIFLISHLFGPFIGNAVPAALYVLDPTPGYDVAVLALSITAFWVFPFVLRAFGHYNLLALLSVQNLIFCILWSCYFNGGVTSPTLPWVLTIPLLAFFYLGPVASLRLTVLGLFAVNLAGFTALYGLGHSVPNDMPLASVQGLGIVSTIATALYVTMMAFYYARILASGLELENEMRGHLATAAELRRATAEAERAGAAKAEFLAKMSHELRTPLNAVIGYSQILLEDAAAAGDTSSAADLGRIHEAGQHLLRLVNEVLDLSKIEAGRMEVLNVEIDLAALIRDAVERCRDTAAKNGNELSIELPSQLGTVVCDAQKLDHALAQILDNAAKFTENGRITVSAERRASSTGDQIAVTVRDTGIGMDRESLLGLFEKFTVAHDATASKYGGTGLGLALSRKLCRLMGGDILVESEVGVGSNFTIRIPALPALENPETAPVLSDRTPDCTGNETRERNLSSDTEAALAVA
jgi:signal transduction histidine kinase